MARAVEVFAQNMRRNQELQAEAAREQAARERRAAEISGLAQTFDRDVEAILRALVGSADTLGKTASALDQTSIRSLDQAQQVAAAAAEASANVSTVAAATEEANKVREDWLRAKAETENIRRRGQEDVSKAHKFGENQRVSWELKGVFTNFMNHPLRNDPVTGLSSPFFGQITGKGGQRNVELSTRITF